MAKQDLGTLELTVKANTKGLDGVVKAINNMVKSLDNMSKKLDVSLKKMDSGFKKMGSSSKKSAEEVSKSADKIKAQISKQDKAMEGARRQFEKLRQEAKNLGAGGGLGGLAARLKATEALFSTGALSSAKYSTAMNRLGQSFTKVGAGHDRIKRAVEELDSKFNKGQISATKYAAALKKLGVNSGAVGKKTKELGGVMTDLSKSVQVALGPLSGVASRLTAITAIANKNTIVIAALVGAFIALGAAATRAIRDGAKFQQQLQVMENRVRATGKAAGFTAKELNTMAETLADDTLASTVEARDAIIALTATTKVSGEVFLRAFKSAQDFADLGLGDLKQNAIQFGRALENPLQNIELLRRKMINFTIAEKALIKELIDVGRLLEAQNIVMGKIEQVGKGASAAALLTLSGSFDTLSERITVFFEKAGVMGGLVDTVKDFIDDLNKSIKELDDRFSAATAFGEALNSIFGNLIKGLGFLVRNIKEVAVVLGTLALGKLILSLGAAAAAVKLLAIRFAALALAIRINPIFLIAGAIAAVGAFAISAFSKTKGLTTAIEGLNKELAKTGGAFNSIKLKRDMEGVKDAIGGMALRAKMLKSQIDALQSKVIPPPRRKPTRTTAGDLLSPLGLETEFGPNTNKIDPAGTLMLLEATKGTKEFRAELKELQEQYAGVTGEIKVFNEALAKGNKRLAEAGDVARANNIDVPGLSESFRNARAALIPYIDSQKELSIQFEVINKLLNLSLTNTKAFADVAEAAGVGANEFGAQLRRMKDELEAVDKRDPLKLFKDNLKLETIALEEQGDLLKFSGAARRGLAAEQEILNREIAEGIRLNKSEAELTKPLNDLLQKKADAIRENVMAQSKLKLINISLAKQDQLRITIKEQATEYGLLNSVLAINEKEYNIQLAILKKRDELLERGAKLTDKGARAELALAEAVARSNEELKKQAEIMGAVRDNIDTMFKGMGDSLFDLFTDAEDRAKKLKDRLRGFLEDVLNDVIQLGIIDPLKQKALDFITGLAKQVFPGFFGPPKKPPVGKADLSDVNRTKNALDVFITNPSAVGTEGVGGAGAGGGLGADIKRMMACVCGQGPEGGDQFAGIATEEAMNKLFGKVGATKEGDQFAGIATEEAMNKLFGKVGATEEVEVIIAQWGVVMEEVTDKVAEKTDSIWTRFGNFMEGLVNDISTGFSNSLNFLGDGLLSVFDASLNFLQTKLTEILNSLSGGGGGGDGGLGNILQVVGIAASIFFGGAAGAAAAQHGGTFTVGGVGGADSQFVPLNLSPGEQVDIKTRVQAQQEEPGVTVIQNIMIETGVSQTVRSEMQNLLPRFKEEAIAAMVDKRNRNPRVFR
jgi:hypothetical protein